MKYKLCAIGLACVTLTACPTTQGPAGSARPGQPAGPAGAPPQANANSSTDCNDNGKLIGALVGGLLGRVLGKDIGGSRGANVGTLLGGALGVMIGADFDRKKCELAKIATKYQVPIQTTPIRMRDSQQPQGPLVATGYEASPAPTLSEQEQRSVVGSTAQVMNPNGEAHFASGSDQLSPRSRQYFAEIARQYVPGAGIDPATPPGDRAKMLATARRQRVFLIGHTDDEGSSQLNADLSERRARAVAALMAEQGVPMDMLFYQGAGESHPIADNRTPEGRQQNRRVEIVELADEQLFRRFVAERAPRVDFYRAAPQPEPTPPAMAKAPSAPPQAAVPRAPARSLGPSSPVDLGGALYSDAAASINVGELLRESGGFSIFSKAHASDNVVAGSCARDRHRASGEVKALANGQSIHISEYLPGLHPGQWEARLNANRVFLKNVGVLRDSAKQIPAAQLQVYSAKNTARPVVNSSSVANIYRGSNGVLYRMFFDGRDGIQCADIVFPNSAPFKARAGKIIYTRKGETVVTDFRPDRI